MFFFPSGLLQRLEEETRANSYIVKERLPKDIEARKKTVHDLQRVVAEPAMGQSDLDELQNKVGHQKLSEGFGHQGKKYLQGSHRLEKYLNLEDFLEKSLKINYVLKSTGKSSKDLEKSLNSSIFCRN